MCYLNSSPSSEQHFFFSRAAPPMPTFSGSALLPVPLLLQLTCVFPSKSRLARTPRGKNWRLFALPVQNKQYEPR